MLVDGLKDRSDSMLERLWVFNLKDSDFRCEIALNNMNELRINLAPAENGVVVYADVVPIGVWLANHIDDPKTRGRDYIIATETQIVPVDGL